MTPDSPADTAGVLAGDVLLSVNGEVPRDVIQYRMLVDEPDVSLEIDRGGLTRQIEIEKADGELLGIEVQSSLFDQVRTCDNHCSFCFIYQLPPGMRKSLYLKDDDFRLSFLYGNFTTLTRFTEADLERVITEGLSPLYVSIHSTEGDVRTALLRNKRGARRAFVGFERSSTTASTCTARWWCVPGSTMPKRSNGPSPACWMTTAS